MKGGGERREKKEGNEAVADVYRDGQRVPVTSHRVSHMASPLCNTRRTFKSPRDREAVVMATSWAEQQQGRIQSRKQRDEWMVICII